MNRFVFVSLLFLGWGFWELSGGRDFEPSYRIAARATVDLTTTPIATPDLPNSIAESESAYSSLGGPVSAPLSESVTAHVTAPSRAVSAPNEAIPAKGFEIQVPIVRASPTDLEALRPQPTAELAVHQTSPSLASEVTLATGFANFSTSTAVVPTLSSPANAAAASPATTSLESANVGGAITPAAVAPFAVLKPDQRTVQGSRVNLRGGPGTSHAVITTLVQGQTVEILRDDGAGWVKLRDKDSGRVGWMARKMLSPSDRF